MKAVVVLMGLAAALPGMQAFAFAPSGHAQGCHSHPSTPLSPISYQCCANGHNWAMTASAVSIPALTATHSCVELSFLSFGVPQVEVVAFFSGSPPSNLPLRI